MSKKFKTPGQKRKNRIRIACILLAIASLAIAYSIKSPAQVAAIKLLNNHETAQAKIIEVREEEEEYRGRKGRKNYRTVTYVDYSFETNGAVYNHTTKVSEYDFKALAGLTKPEVWFAPGKADSAQLSYEVKASANKTPIANVIDTGIVVIPIAIVLNFILAFFFGREPKGYMPEGFYTENSWLDVEDNFLVILDDESIISLSFHDKSTKKIQHMYQNNSSLEQMIAESKGTIDRVPLENIKSLKNEHFRDTIRMTYLDGDSEGSKNLEFLNATVKDHAFESISKKLGGDFSKSQKQFSRLDDTKGKFIFAGIVAGAIYFFADNNILLGIGGLIMFFIIKSIIARLLDPTLRVELIKNET